jgi:hypothetical protein
MRFSWALAAAAVVVAGVLRPAILQGATVRQASAPLCDHGPGPQPRLLPRDEASQRPDFLRFREGLQTIVQRRDVAALVQIVDPSIRVAFDDASGVEAFMTYHVDNPERDFWAELAAVLRLGGVFTTWTTFAAPYTFAAWPDEFDAFSCKVVIGEGVRVRAAPGTSARTLTLLSHAIVEWVPVEPEANWERVRLADGRIGFVAARYLRSPVDLRAFFEFKDGRWWLTTYVAGD